MKLSNPFRAVPGIEFERIGPEFTFRKPQMKKLATGEIAIPTPVSKIPNTGGSIQVMRRRTLLGVLAALSFIFGATFAALLAKPGGEEVTHRETIEVQYGKAMKALEKRQDLH